MHREAVKLGRRGAWWHPEEIPRKNSKAQDWLYLHLTWLPEIQSVHIRLLRCLFSYCQYDVTRKVIVV
jgi:hypothetical protein